MDGAGIVCKKEMDIKFMDLSGRWPDILELLQLLSSSDMLVEEHVQFLGSVCNFHIDIKLSEDFTA